MAGSPLVLLDPEIVAPSIENAADISFWNRLNDWASDPSPRIGVSAMSALQALAEKPPQVVGLPQGDFWKIVSKLMSRGLRADDVGRELCELHLRHDYEPFMGHPGNSDRLILDLRSISSQRRIVLATAIEAWRSEDRSCKDCARDNFLHSFKPAVQGEISPAVSLAWRSEYLATSGRDLEGIADFADKMFPNLIFADSAWSKLGTLVGDASANVRGVLKHLGVLSDHAYLIWGDELNTDARQSALRSHGVVASPESTQTHRNQSAMQERDFHFNGRVLRCEWHTKLRANVNRIHFRVDQDGVFIGVITRHLSV